MVDRDLAASKLSELADHLARVRTRRTARADLEAFARGSRALDARPRVDISATLGRDRLVCARSRVSAPAGARAI